MGQYWIIVNEDKKEFIFPHIFGDGLKLLEFGCSAEGTLTGLTLLLADRESNGRGGGDFGVYYDSASPNIMMQNEAIGRWHGDRIKIVGDYGDKDYYDEVNKKQINLYHLALEYWKDISTLVLRVMVQDEYIRKDQEQRWHKSLAERLAG